MAYRIPLFDVDFDENEERAVVETVRSKWVSMGQKTATLEERFRSRLGAAHVVALSSCTAALHLAMVLARLGEGDEVIVPSLTFVATANAVRYVGARPVFADICGPQDLTIDPKDVRLKITTRTRAIVPMHYAGFPCDMVAIAAIAREHGLTVIEDAAHAIDVTVDGRKLGTLGEFGCFSLFSNKVITAAEGGFLATPDEEAAARARLLRSHGMTTLSYERAKGHATGYDVVDLGYNYRLDDLRAALALAQLDKLDRILATRARLRLAYLERLGGVDNLILPHADYRGESANYIFPVVLARGGAARRDEVRKLMAQDGVQTSVHYPPVHRFSIFADAGVALPATEYVADHEITLPLYNTLGDDGIDIVCASLTHAMAATG
ncbi:MAG: DegT/DnrJ/EryC1/StrS family aminotransferase [Armatimonadetes bacterium]|nr:DegT/DnrJ/EryC1/StrS family aminotransferase [Armatimonadota bacterium]